MYNVVISVKSIKVKKSVNSEHNSNFFLLQLHELLAQENHLKLVARTFGKQCFDTKIWFFTVKFVVVA